MPLLNVPPSVSETPQFYVVSSLGGALAFIALLIFARSTSTRGRIPSVAPRWQEWFPIWAHGSIREYLIEGSRKYPNTCFRVPIFPKGDVIILNGTKLISELRNMPDEIFSFNGVAEKTIQSKYTMGSSSDDDHYAYTTPIIRTTLTRNLGALFPDIAEEMRLSFEDQFGSSKEWKQVKAHSALMKIVCRTSNRVVVGPELCRNLEFQKIHVEHTIAVMKSAFFISLFPEFLHPVVGPLLSTQKKYTRISTKILKDEIESRQKSLEKYGSDWADKPNDYLMWLIESAPSKFEQEPSQLALRVLGVNFAAIHTSSLTFSHALLHLAARPECVKPMREEVERIIAEDGWTKLSMQKMRKVDSFIRESSRMNALSLTSMGRLALQDYTLSDGTKVLKGSTIAVSSYSAHMDEANHPNPEKFDPFRFSEIREEDGEGTKHQMVATSPEYLPFGLGRHACPGRFFAANEIKAMLCYILVNYDVKLPGGSTNRPRNRFVGASVIPSKDDEVLVRRRFK